MCVNGKCSVTDVSVCFGYACFEGHRELVALDHTSPLVADWAGQVACHWLDRGADGWRLDAAYAIPARFLAELVTRIRREHPDAWLFGEVIHGDYAGLVAATGLDAVTQYELHKAIWSSLNDANLWELRWSLLRHAEMAETFAPVTFVGNHDVTRLATRLADPTHVAAALAVLFTVPGRPGVYYGDELGWTGVKEDRAGGDDAIRPALPAHDRAEPQGPGGALADQQHRHLIAQRRARPWLARGRLAVLEVANHRLAYQVDGDDSAVRVVVDLDHTAPEPDAGWSTIAVGPHVWVGEAIAT